MSAFPGPDAADEAATLQLPLPLPPLEAFGAEDFLPAPSNRDALAAVAAWPAWPAPALLLEGPRGAGKTHLARLWAGRARALLLEPTDLREGAWPPGRPGATASSSVVVDGADTVPDEAQLLHLYNAVAGSGGHLLLTAERPLSSWAIELPDLRSRLRTAWSVRIGPPDDALLGALLVKQLADRQLRVEPEVVRYLSERMERSFAGARALVEALDRMSLGARRPIRLGLAREALRALTATSPEAERVARNVEGRTAGWISG